MNDKKKHKHKTEEAIETQAAAVKTPEAGGQAALESERNDSWAEVEALKRQL